MSGYRYDVNRISLRTLKGIAQVLINRLEIHGLRPETSAGRMAVSEAIVYEPTVAELERELVDALVKDGGTTTEFVLCKVRDIRKAHCREAKETDDE